MTAADVIVLGIGLLVVAKLALSATNEVRSRGNALGEARPEQDADELHRIGILELADKWEQNR